MDQAPEAVRIISRDAAIEAGLKTYFTGVACKAGHVAERTTSSGVCVECKKAYAAAYYAKRKKEDPDTLRKTVNANVARHYERNREAILARKRAHYAQNAEAIRARTQEYRDKQKAKRAATDPKPRRSFQSPRITP